MKIIPGSAWFLGLLIGLAALSLPLEASACRSPDSEATIIFDQAPRQIETGKVLLRGSIGRMQPTKFKLDGLTYSVIATFDGTSLSMGGRKLTRLPVAVRLSDCSKPFDGGHSGYLVGYIRPNHGGQSVFIADQESQLSRRVRKSRETQMGR